MRNLLDSARAVLAALLAILLLPAAALAQNAVIRGTVTSADGNTPLTGVNVVIPSLGLSATTGDRGAYTLTIPAARIPAAAVAITARGIGYKAVTRSITIRAGEQTEDFSLQQDINRLEEVVVTGVLEGTERAKVAFSVGRLSQEDLPVPATDPLRALAGKVAGVRVQGTSGRPGSSPEILMRGPTSINAAGRSLGPLIIIDGVTMSVGNLDEIAPTDIDHIEVIKGASGATLYGARAANGVISITTKRGLRDREGVQFNIRTEVGANDIEGDFGSAQNHRFLLDETGTRFCVFVAGAPPCSRTIDWNAELRRINSVPGDFSISPVSLVYGSPAGADLKNLYQLGQWPGRAYNPVAQIVTRQPFYLTAADMTGKIGQTSFFVSGSWQKQEGAVKALHGARYFRGRLNLDYTPRSDMKVSVSSMYDDTYTDQNNISFFRLTRVPAGTDLTALDTLGRRLVRVDVGPSGQQNEHPLRDTDSPSDEKSNRLMGSVNASYFPTDWVTFEGIFGYDTRNRNTLNYTPKGFRTTTAQPAPGANGGSLNISSVTSKSYNATMNATFRRQLRDNLQGRLRVGANYEYFNSEDQQHGGNTLRVADVISTDNVGANFFTSSGIVTTKTVGLSAAATLDWMDRYILEGSFRRDGFSLFGADNRWANFGRVSAVWRVSEEPWWNRDGFISDLRLRASRGSAGGTPRFSAQYETYNLSAGNLTLGQAGNRKLKPETTVETEAGLDMTLFGKVGVEAAYIYSTTKDQILPVNTPAALGFTTQWQNAGTLENRTWELGVTVPIVNSRNVYWQVRGTWDRNRTYIKELFVPEFIYSAGVQGTTSFFTVRQGDRWGNIWGRKFLTRCSELPTAESRADCGDGKSFQVNDQGYLVWVGAGNSWRDGITKNLWSAALPASQSPFNYQLHWGMPIVDRDPANPGVGKRQIIGNVFPDFRFSVSNDFQYKNLTIYALVDATIGHDVDNNAKHWSLLDFQSGVADQQGLDVEHAKPVGYYWRTGSPEAAGTGGFYDVLDPSSWSVEDASFAKLREVSVTYKIGRLVGVGDWTVGVIGRNLLTITDYTGFDPEVGVVAGNTNSGFLNQVDAFGYPNLRVFTFTLSTRF